MFQNLFVIFDAFKKVQAHIPSDFFCSLVKNFGTSLAQIFCMPSSKVKISWTVWRFKFKTLLIILTVKRVSDLTRSLTLVTFSSVFHVQGLPERGSSSTLSRPSKNALCHLKIFCCVLLKFDTKFHRATLLEISFLHFRKPSLLHTLTQLAVTSDMLMLSS